MIIDPATAKIALAAIAPKAMARTAAILKQPIDAVRARFLDVFGEHVRVSVESCASVKTIASDDRPRALRDIYVPLTLRNKNTLVKDYKLATHEGAVSRLLVKGTAGAGKTMLMRYLTLETLSNSERLPLIISLRDVGDPRETSFIKSVHRLCNIEGKDVEFALFNAGLKAGLFSFFFDGLDEVNPSYRETTFRQMQRFPLEYPDTRVTISSRPETETAGFSLFHEYSVEPLEIPDSCELIRRVDNYSEEKRESFITKLVSGGFRDRATFAKNPLLCLLMFMTFSDAGEVPERAALFYAQAFDTLYSRHDASKGPFKRIYRCGLDKEQLRRLFRLFCYRTIANRLLFFDDMQIEYHMHRSLELEKLSAMPADVVWDLIESLCLLYRDGGRIHFVHRSFQEFFAAEFLMFYRRQDAFMDFDAVLSDGLGTKIGPLLYDLSPSIMEQTWTITILQDLLHEFDPVISPDSALVALAKRIEVRDDTGTISDFTQGLKPKTAHRLDVLASIYGGENVETPDSIIRGAKAYPVEYESFRDALVRDPLRPGYLADQLKREIEEIERAHRERRVQQQYKVNIWSLDLADKATMNWLQRAELLDALPRVYDNLASLERSVKTRSDEALSLDILS